MYCMRCECVLFRHVPRVQNMCDGVGPAMFGVYPCSWLCVCCLGLHVQCVRVQYLWSLGIHACVLCVARGLPRVQCCSKGLVSCLTVQRL